MSNQEMSIGTPQLAILALVVFLVFRWFFNSSPSTTSTTGMGSSRTRSTRRITPEMIDAVQAMFPQVSSAAIRYDLERNGGDIEATTEKILAGATLREPPVVPTNTSNTSNLRTTSTRPQTTASRRQPQQPSTSQSSSHSTTHTDLITRFNLQESLKTFTMPDKSSIDVKGKAVQRNDKASLMVRAKERRNLMILEARKKMEEMIAREKA